MTRGIRGLLDECLRLEYALIVELQEIYQGRSYDHLRSYARASKGGTNLQSGLSSLRCKPPDACSSPDLEVSRVPSMLREVSIGTERAGLHPFVHDYPCACPNAYLRARTPECVVDDLCTPAHPHPHIHTHTHTSTPTPTPTHTHTPAHPHTRAPTHPHTPIHPRSYTGD